MQTIDNRAVTTERQRYILYIQADADPQGGSWQFELFDPKGERLLEASGLETDSSADRLALLGTVRALESLDGPAEVVLVGCSRYVSHGLRFGLASWREQEWLWECFGQMVPIRNADLWQRLDRALAYHKVEPIGDLRPARSTKPKTTARGRVDQRRRRPSVPAEKPDRPCPTENVCQQRRQTSNALPTGRSSRLWEHLQVRFHRAVRGIRRTVGELARSWFEAHEDRTLLGVDR